MSTFCGIYEYGEQPLCGDELLPMANALRMGGPDRQSTVVTGPVGLVHCMLHTTKESLRESQPYTDDRTGLMIVGDVRIDNASELMKLLGLSGTESTGPTDIELVLFAYQKWGRSCLRHLLGDFAFAIWNPETGEIFCARDHIGVKPLYYIQVGHSFLFASEIKGLLANRRVPRMLDRRRLLQYLCSDLPDADATFYHGIHRLPAAHWISVRSGNIVRQRYWQPDPAGELPHRTDEAFAEQFRHLLFEAVRCRMRSAFPIGAHLSGGLDSSSIACVAREIQRATSKEKLKVFTNRFPRIPTCDESEYVRSVLATGGFDPTSTDLDTTGPFSSVEPYFQYEEEGVYSWGTYLAEQSFKQVAQAGVRVCLDGFDGDTIVSHGMQRFFELGREGKWAEFKSEATALEQLLPDITVADVFDVYGRDVFRHLAAEKRWGNLFESMRGAQKHFFSQSWRSFPRVLAPALPAQARLLWRGLRSRTRPTRSPVRMALELFRAQILRGLRQGTRGASPPDLHRRKTVRESQCDSIASSLYTHDLEISARLQARHGIESRHPFLDKRLVEFCLALPARQKLRDGYGRVVMRHALAGILPEKVRWRPDKTTYRPAFVWTSLKYDAPSLEKTVGQFSTLGTLIDTEYIAGRFRAFREEGKATPNEFGQLWKALTIGLWLRQTGLATSLISPVHVQN